MSTALVVSDIHANYPALEAVLDDAPDFGEVICVGDIVGLMGFPAEIVEWLRENADRCVAGNHDVAVLEYGEGHVAGPELAAFELEYTTNQLDDKQTAWVNDLPTYAEYRDDGLLLTHAQASVELSSGYTRGNAGIRPKDVATVASNVDDWVDILLHGHTHKQHAVDCAEFGHDVVVCNPGAVGQPLGTARYATVDMSDGSYELHRVEYDPEDVTERLRELDAPNEWWV